MPTFTLEVTHSIGTQTTPTSFYNLSVIAINSYVCLIAHLTTRTLSLGTYLILQTHLKSQLPFCRNSNLDLNSSNHHPHSLTATRYLPSACQPSVLPIMNFLLTLFIGLSTLVWGGFANVPLTRDIHWTNTTMTTTTASVGCGTGIPFGSLTTTSKTTSAEPSIYTIPSNYTVPGNCSVGPLQWHLYSLQAFTDRETQTAQ